MDISIVVNKDGRFFLRDINGNPMPFDESKHAMKELICSEIDRNYDEHFAAT